ncbi:uncharacterized protein LOC113515069 [Galleria mellonella]|uniref:Uncharacterized protein LOC113515069 n=1 Tax=Galleria mellonella TaxID=7137 RepID=A0A6J1WSB9_GALME|nr:uncharacterized protein LOC113515069 [Galleria mellonella]
MGTDSIKYTLGKKHKIYNELMKKSIEDDQIITSIEIKGADIEKLMEIDLACHKRDIIYVQNILMGADMLYVSRVLKKSDWLLNAEYAHIIEPEYLRAQIFPKMTIKAKNKLMKYIRNNLKDEVRVESFFNDEKDIKKALKWLPNCSLPFIKEKVKKHFEELNSKLFKRLCEKSVEVLEIGFSNYGISSYKRDKLQCAMLFSIIDVNKYLDIVEKSEYYNCPKFNHRMTNIIMQHCSERIIKNFEKYATNIHLATFVKYLKKENIKDFLYTQAIKLPKISSFRLSPIFQFHSLKIFIKAMPFKDRFNFVNAIFIDKVHVNKKEQSLYDESELYKMSQLYKVSKYKNDYVWYQFAPFDKAFTELTKLIRSESSHNEKQSMLEVLILCVGNNAHHLQVLLQYYCDKHNGNKIEHQINFVKKLLSRTMIQNYNKNTWNLLDIIFKNMDIYVETEVEYENIQECIEAIIVHKILTDEQVPEIIEKQFKFNTLKKYGDKLKSTDKDKIFNYLYNFIIPKVSKSNVTSKIDIEECLNLISNILDILKDWDKNIADYPIVLDKLNELIKLNEQNAWNVTLSRFYNVKKSWRKYMFEQSLIIHPSEEVCVNALKHDPELLVRYKNVVDTLSCNDSISLRQLLSKLRIYWPQTLGKNITNQYLSRLNKPNGHKALACGLCSILPQDQLLDIITKYTPEKCKINLENIDDNVVNLQKYIAKNMHKARPHPPPDSILSYAKGDYLQYAIPSLLAIFHNLSPMSSKEHIQKLINSPISLQKHGIRFAFNKLELDDIKNIFSNIWKTTKNVTIRAIIFQFTYNLICKEENSVKVQEFWELFEVFIDNLSYEEDKKIYELLVKVDNIPLSIRPKYLIKCYNFLKLLTAHVTNEKESYEFMINNLICSTRSIMEFMCPDFITKRLLECFDNKNSSTDMNSVLSAFLLSAKNEETQTKRYENILYPYMQRCFNTWQENSIKSDFEAVLSQLQYDLRDYVIQKNMFVPVKLFTDIQKELESSLSRPENYLLLTKWKLIVSLVRLIKDVKSSEWNEICSEIASELGKAYLQYLKEDVETLFPCIYVLFSQAVESTLNYFNDGAKYNVYTCMLSDQHFIQSYLTVMMLYDNYDSNKTKELQKIFSEHPSSEVKMHFYYKLFKDNQFQELLA